MTTQRSLIDDALAIWQAGVSAVDSERLVREAIQVEGDWLHIQDDAIGLNEIRRIVVVGAGKAGAGMAAGFEAALGEQLLEEKAVEGWINVPAGCERELSRIHLHVARPAGVNEPTKEGVEGTQRILEMVAGLGPEDLCLCLLSGGGSALTPAPVPGVSLADKLAVTRHLSAAGANITQLNTVRKQLSRFKGGGLMRTCRAGRLYSLIISDVLGDPLDVIASGPTVEDTSTPQDALAVLEKYGAAKAGVSSSVFECLRAQPDKPKLDHGCLTKNFVIGNNATAVDAAGLEAVRLGYAASMTSCSTNEGLAEGIGEHLAEMALHMASHPGPDCLVSGGEPVVQLAESSRRGKGGRNQQLALAALQRLWDEPSHELAILSGGTDGEDGPTDAAGAYFNADSIDLARNRGLDPGEYLARNDAYHFFEALDQLIKTGPTHTNVCDIRVVLVKR